MIVKDNQHFALWISWKGELSRKGDVIVFVVIFRQWMQNMKCNSWGDRTNLGGFFLYLEKEELSFVIGDYILLKLKTLKDFGKLRSPILTFDAEQFSDAQ